MQDPQSTANSPLFSLVTWGDWDENTVRLDFDDSPLAEVKLWAFRTLKRFKLKGFIILLSSYKTYVVKNRGKILYEFRKCSYLVVFDRPVRWNTNVAAMNWTALESGNPNLQRYVRMQCIKKTSTARISNKGKKKPPKIIYRYGSQDMQIKKFLETRKIVLTFLKRHRANKKD